MKVSIRLSGLIFTTCFMNVITSKGQKLKTNKRGRINFTALDILAGFNSDAMKQFFENSVFQSSITGSKELRGELGHHQIDL